MADQKREPAATEPKLTLFQKMVWICKNLTVEPIILCYTVSNLITYLGMQNLNMEKACRVNLGYSKNVCDALAARNSTGYTEEHEVEVQKLVANMVAYKNIVHSVIPSILILFFGAWSDRHNKRKPCILIPLTGEIMTVGGYVLSAYYFYEFRLEYNIIIDALAPSLTGGGSTMTMGIMSYISNMSSVSARTIRIGAVNIVSNVSITIGLALSGVLYKLIQFYGVFFSALLLYVAGLVYGIFNLKECPKGDCGKDDVPKKGFLRDFFDIKAAREILQVALKDGGNNRKKRICTIMVLVMVIVGPVHGEMSVMYLFVRYKYNWSEIDYSLYSTYNFIIHMCGTIFSLVFFSKYLKLDDALLGVISNLSKILSCFVYAFAPTPTVFYLAVLVEMLNGTSFIAMRSIISKLVPTEELGKIYALFGICEGISPLVYGPMYSMVYKLTINHLPGTFFLIGGFLTTPAVFIFLWLYKQNKLDAEEEELEKAHAETLLNEKVDTELMVINDTKNNTKTE